MVTATMGVFRGERLQRVRKHRGLSQEALAEHLDTTQQHVSLIERGATDPLPDMLVRIARALDVSADYLLGIVDDPKQVFAPQLSASDLRQRLLWALEKGYIAEALETFTQLTKGSNNAHIPGE